MGLKSGSRDAGLDETEDEIEDEDEQPEEHESDDIDTVDPDLESSEQSTADTGSETTDATSAPSDTENVGQRPSMSSIPYKLRREKVNEGREQVPYFLREEIIEEEDQLQDTLEEILGEDVYKSDYREAAMVVAQRNPELVAEVLREWGYDLEAA